MARNGRAIINDIDIHLLKRRINTSRNVIERVCDEAIRVHGSHEEAIYVNETLSECERLLDSMERKTWG